MKGFKLAWLLALGFGCAPIGKIGSPSPPGEGPSRPGLTAAPVGPTGEFVLQFRYPTNVSLTDPHIWWYLQSSTNLIHWETIRALTNANAPVVTNDRPWMFFRVFGYRWP